MNFSIFPRAVYQTTSKFSGEIVIKEQFGQRKLYVQETLQSGGIIKNIWRKALGRITNYELRITNVLVLGLGGGTVVKLVDKISLKGEIVGIEIDPEIIKVGKKYFGLGEMKNLRTIQADAFEWIARKTPRRWALRLRSGQAVFLRGGGKNKPKDTSEVARRDSSDGGEKINKTFDLIIVDLYLGKKFPKKAESKKFLENVKRFLSKNGLAIFNRLRLRGEDLEGFEEKLKNHFASVEKIKTKTNLFFLARG